MLHLEKKLFFIYNPHAGKENIKGKLYGIIQAMSDAGYAITIYPTRAPQDAIEQIRNRRLGRCHREVPPASPPSCPPRAAIRIPLCRHRADPALIAPPSRPPCADIRIAPHLSPRVAAAPGP